MMLICAGLAVARAQAGPEQYDEPEASPTDDDDRDHLEEIVVEGDSQEARLSREPIAVTSIDTTEAKRASADLGEVLAQTPGVAVRRTGGLGSGSTLALHGLQGDQVRLFVDGIPLDAAGYVADLSAIPVNVVDRIDVYKGVLPIRLGTDALGGALDLVSRFPARGVHGSASAQVGSFGTVRLSGSASFRPKYEGWYLRFDAFGDQSENNYFVDVEVANDDFQLVPATVRRFHDRYRGVGGRMTTGAVSLPWARRLELQIFGSAGDKQVQHDPVMVRPYGEVVQRGSTTGLSVRYEVGGRTTDLEVVASYAQVRIGILDVSSCVYDWTGTCVREVAGTGERGDPSDTVFVDQQGFSRIAGQWRPARGHFVDVASSGRLFQRAGDNRLNDNPDALDAIELQRELYSLINGLSYTYRSEDEKLETLAFVKHYHQTLRSETIVQGTTAEPENRSINPFGAGLGVRWEPTEGWRLKASYEFAIRQPSAAQVFGDGLFVIQNLELRPERSHNVNVGVQASTPSSAPWWTKVEVLGVLRDTDDQIGTFGNELSVTNENLLTARTLGLEVDGLAGRPDGRFVVQGSGTWLDLRNTGEGGLFGPFAGDRIPNRPWLFATGTARTQLPLSRGLTFSGWWTSRYTGAFNRNWESVVNPAFASGIDPQLAHSVGVGLLWSSADERSMALTADLQNLTNEALFDVFGVQRPGRAVSAKFTTNW